MCLLLDKDVTAASMILNICRRETVSCCVTSRIETQAVSVQFGAS